VFFVAVLLSLRVAALQRDRVKQSHVTDSPLVFCTPQSTHVCQRTHTDYDYSRIVKWLLLASPFLALRTAYGMLGIFETTGANMFTSTWSSLFGSATPIAFIALVPEYITVCTYIRLLRFRVRTCREMNQLLREGRDAGGHEMGGLSHTFK
jgi:hypothetical protein